MALLVSMWSGSEQHDLQITSIKYVSVLMHVIFIEIRGCLSFDFVSKLNGSLFDVKSYFCNYSLVMKSFFILKWYWIYMKWINDC